MRRGYLNSKIRVMKIKLELKPVIKYFISFISVFFFIFSIYIYVTPKYINENPKLIYLCPIACLTCIIGFFSSNKLRIHVFDNYIEKHGIFRTKKILFHNIKKLILSDYNTLRIISDDNKIEITNDLINQKEAIKFILTKNIPNNKIKN
jgi:hypothetical protein